MVILAWVLGILGGLSAIMGIVTATDIVDITATIGSGFTPLMWLALGAVLLLGCIAALHSPGSHEG